MHRGDKTLWCPMYRGVKTPQCPKYRGVETPLYFVSQNSPVSYVPGSRKGLAELLNRPGLRAAEEI